MSQKVKKIAFRIVSDYFLPPRIGEYRQLLETLLREGYRFKTVRETAEAILSGNTIPEKLAVLRHDIDTDPFFVQDLVKVESSLNVRSTYYFRLSTFRSNIVQAAVDAGMESSYHYEEVASFAKQKKIMRAPDIRTRFNEIRDVFQENLYRLRKQTGLPMDTVASHGDFANRRLGVPNTELLVGSEFRKRCGILCEAYDPWFEGRVTARFSDAPYPVFWKSGNPRKAAVRATPFLLILMHPRHWRCNWGSNTRENITRLLEGIRFN